MNCQHEEFDAAVEVNRILKDDSVESPASIRYVADIRITCRQCGVPMRFIGLPSGVDMNGAAVSADGTQGRFAIAPNGEVLSVIDGAPVGFTVRRTA